MINYYDYDISNEKDEDSYGGTATKVRRANNTKKATKTKSHNRYAQTRDRQERVVDELNYSGFQRTRNLESNNDSLDMKKIARQTKLEQSRKNARHIAMVGIAFMILFTISYRYALINSKFNEKENLKDQLAQIKKENAQLQVNIEQGMNIKNIEKEAQERLGMQKLDANNKIYVSLPKKDYIESASKKIKEEKNENWFTKLLNILKGN